MSLREIQVECYAGGRADETPRRVTIAGRRHTIARLLSESLEEGAPSSAQRRRFRLLTTTGTVLELIRTADGAWCLEAERPATPEP